MDPAASSLEWQSVLTAAEAGQVSLDPAVGSDLDRICDNYLTRLGQLYQNVRSVAFLEGFGGFPSSEVLQQKFTQKAMGGDRSLEAVLLQHIDAVKLAKQAVARAIQNFAEQDSISGDHISGTTP
ncbi:hypothetical protein [Nocardia jiangsuensis]|uniref:Uncharacterized protein n=1 Tax=Nocardia jiangsuensis TaxID=1691563 RepID=A0ABV8DXN0_9NOCA